MHEKISLRYRSPEKELLDQDNIPFEDIWRVTQELNTINTWLGGHAITIKGVKQLLGRAKAVHVCEIGCGDGNNLYHIYKWCQKNKIHFSCTGIDIKQQCIDAARQNTRIANANWITSDYKTATFVTKPDIIFSSLFCHHFSNEELVSQLQWMRQNAATGFFINDLQRNRFAYHAIKTLTRLFSTSHLVKHDAPLSVARAFHKKDWIEMLYNAGIKNFSIEWKWAFRYLITYKHAA